MKNFLPEEIAVWSGGSWSRNPSVELKGFCKDSRGECAGMVYAAIPGERFDGHDFIKAAVERGAAAVLVSSAFQENLPVPMLKVESPVSALQDIARGYRVKVDPFVTGVTGSSGKTTVKTMIAACLAKRFKTQATLGNWNNHIGLPLTLLEMESDCEALVVEAGMNHAGEMGVLCGISMPDWGVVTNVGPVHLENFPSVEAIANEKAVLLESLPIEGCGFIDGDGKFFDLLSAKTKCPLVTVSELDGDYIYRCVDKSAVSIRERSTGDCIDIKLSIPGRHIAYDAVLAAAVARKKGVEWGDIVEALSGMKALPMRWACETAGGVKIINDAYNANPMSMRASISAFLEERQDGMGGVGWLVLGDMLELGEASRDEHRELGKWLSGKGSVNLVTVGNQAREIADGLGKASGVNVVSVAEAADAAEAVICRVAPGDAVLFKGSRGIGLEKAVNRIKEFLISKAG